MLRRRLDRTGLARALSKSGYCSRSSARKLVCDGRVRLNGRAARDPETPVVLDQDSIEVDGRKLGPAKRLYFVMNKPRGIVTSAHDEKGRDTVYSLLPESKRWVAPVGRLDKASEGLLLLTNDSEWGSRILAPEMHVEKTYHVQVAALGDEELIQRLTAGTRTTDGDFLRVKRAAIVGGGKKNSWLEVVLDEGKNGKDPGRCFQVLQIIQGEIGSGVVLRQTLAANLNHSQQMLLRIYDRCGHQLLNGVGAG